MATDWGAPTGDVLARAGAALADGEPAVLATVVGVEGNAYRRPGAKMLVSPEGDVGALTAGCVEDEVRRVAEEVLDAGERRVETYDLTGDDDVWGMGVGCDGVVDVLLEPLSAAHEPMVAAHEGGEPLAALLVLDGPDAGARAYYRPGEGVFDPASGRRSAEAEDADGPPAWLADAVEEQAAELLAREHADTVRVETGRGEASVFVDAIVPPPDLVVCGSGHDVRPVVEQGVRSGFRVAVAGFRGGVDLSDRFPAAHRTLTTSPSALREDLALDDRTYAVVMTHNVVDDRLAVDELLRSPVPYVGLMGPRERFEEMREAFEEEGRTLSTEERERLYTPVGLDLGGGSPDQIATSVVAELLAVHNDRDPGHLRGREAPIHERVAVDDDGAPE